MKFNKKILVIVCNVVLLNIANQCFASTNDNTRLYSKNGENYIDKIYSVEQNEENQFIENIENFICINWFFDLFISLTLLISKIKDLTYPAKKYYSLILVLFILFIVHKYFSNNFYNTLIIYKIFPYIYLAFLILIPLLLTIKIIKPKT